MAASCFSIAFSVSLSAFTAAINLLASLLSMSSIYGFTAPESIPEQVIAAIAPAPIAPD